MEITEQVVAERTAGLDPELQRKITCALVGHSRLQTSFFCYFNCGRCGEQVGDALGSLYNPKTVVIAEHYCPDCAKNAESLTWQDTINLPEKMVEELAILADPDRRTTLAVEKEREHAAAMQAIRTQNEKRAEELRAAREKESDASSNE